MYLGAPTGSAGVDEITPQHRDERGGDGIDIHLRIICNCTSKFSRNETPSGSP